MPNINLEITNEYDGERLDSVISELLYEYSRSYIQKLFSDGSIILNGKPCLVKKTPAHTGDKVEISIPEDTGFKLIPEDTPLNIVYEDENVLVIDKERGMVVHPAPGNETGTLVNGIIYYLGDSFVSAMGNITSPERPGIVHRIDKDTSGLLVIAKTTESFKDLSGQFKDHSITRKYLALTYNNFPQDEGTIDLAIGRDPVNRLKRKVNGLEPRNAVTHYKVLERMGNFTLIEARLDTGRTHQIRVHMAYIGNPVVGDPVYGPRKDMLKAGGQVLHAETLGFRNLKGEYLEFNSNPPKYFTDILTKARNKAK